MDTLVSVVVIGVQQGAVFALIGLGLAIVYKSTRILNFAQGELGTVPAFAAYLVLTGFSTAQSADVATSTSRLAIATVLAVVVGAALGVALNVVVIRRLANASVVTALVATVGVTLFLTSVQVVAFEPQRRSFPRYVDGDFGLPFVDVAVEWHTVVILGVLGLASGALAAFFRTQMGVALLATAQEPFAAELQGVPVERMRALAWGAAGAFGGLAGVLGAGVFEGISPGFMTTQFLIPAFAGVILGGITSMPGAVLGGILVGIAQAGANQIARTFELDVPGPPSIAILVVLLGVLYFRPRGLLGQEA